jgi:hypothetical protein
MFISLWKICNIVGRVKATNLSEWEIIVGSSRVLNPPIFKTYNVKGLKGQTMTSGEQKN